MIAGDLALADLPGAWNDGMEALLGITPAGRPPGLPAGHPLVRRRLGLLPDLHPGRHDRGPALRAAKAPCRRSPRRSARGDFAPLMIWLREKVHGAAARLSTDALLEEVTGRPLDPAVFKAHLQARYLG